MNSLLPPLIDLYFKFLWLFAIRIWFLFFFHSFSSPFSTLFFRLRYSNAVCEPYCGACCCSFSIQLQLLFGHLHCYLLFISFAETIDHFQKVFSDCKWSAYRFDENESTKRRETHAHTHMTHSHPNWYIYCFPLICAHCFSMATCAFASQTIKQNNRKSVS